MSEIVINFEPNPKQELCLKYLRDKTTRYILYGGSKGCGKTRIGCYWLIENCLTYPGTRWIIGKAHLTEIYRSVLKTFQEIIKDWNIVHLVNYNQQRNIITFKNGSEIFLIDLYPNPSDLEYNDLSGIEVTGIFIDELSEIDNRAFEVLKTLLRYKLRENNLTPKILAASNPCLGWPFHLWYRPWEERKLDKSYAFVQALPKDNLMHLGQEYIEQLETMEEGPLKERYLGNWYYDLSDDELFNIQQLQNCFYNYDFININNTTYLCADIADLGNDRTCISIYRGWSLIKLEFITQKDQLVVLTKIQELMKEFKITPNHVICDNNGIGGYISAFIKGSIRYIPHMKSINGANFKNIKSQLMYHYANKINKLEVNFDMPYNDDIAKELTAYKKKIKNEIHDITSKEEVKRKLKGKSPDIADSIYLRSYFDLKPNTYIVEFINPNDPFDNSENNNNYYD